MAANLNIDIGIMIIIGTLVALPTAALGLVVCRLMNRLMDVPMRPYSDAPEPEPLEDDQLPGLAVSLLPVILPVILITVNTVSQTIADAEHAALLRPADVADWPGFAAALATPGANRRTGPAARIKELLPEQVNDAMQTAAESGQADSQLQAQLSTALNGILENREFYEEETMAGIRLPDQGQKLLQEGIKKLSPAEVERFNRLVLEAAFPDQIAKHVGQTPRRKTANLTALLGNANLALLLSAAIAMFVLLRKRRLTLLQLAATTETALMSGGVIILITAAGGAFGAMLREAQIEATLRELMSDDGQATGWMMLFAGFLVAAVLKTAQGSSTVAMITASAMLAAMNISPEALPYHPVYLATAIGSGSLVGAWMNDSGFWIFARMSALTEVEALKSWTVLLVILGLSGLGFTVLFARLMPLV